MADCSRFLRDCKQILKRNEGDEANEKIVAHFCELLPCDGAKDKAAIAKKIIAWWNEKSSDSRSLQFLQDVLSLFDGDGEVPPDFDDADWDLIRSIVEEFQTAIEIGALEAAMNGLLSAGRL